MQIFPLFSAACGLVLLASVGCYPFRGAVAPGRSWQSGRELSVRCIFLKDILTPDVCERKCSYEGYFSPMHGCQSPWSVWVSSICLSMRWVSWLLGQIHLDSEGKWYHMAYMSLSIWLNFFAVRSWVVSPTFPVSKDAYSVPKLCPDGAWEIKQTVVGRMGAFKLFWWFHAHVWAMLCPASAS